jgi:sulfur-carrier protein
MIKVLFFAHLQDQVGLHELTLPLSQTTIKEIKESFQREFPLAQWEQVMAAINEEYAMDQDVVQAGDTVAFIPPVSGG